MDLNRNQVLAIFIAILSVLAASTAQLTDLFGVGPAKAIISAAGLLNGIMSSVLAVITGTASSARVISDLKGVDNVIINKDATPALARLALDPTVDNVSPAPGAEAKLKQIAAS